MLKQDYRRWTPGANIEAPLALYTCLVAPGWIDYNGHMTESSYLWAFGEASDALFHYVGIDDAYRATGQSFYTVETHLNAAELLQLGARPSEVHTALFRQKTPEHLRFMAEVLGRIQMTAGGRVGWIVISKALLEKTGYVPGDTQEFIDLVKSIKGLKVAVLLRESDEPGKVKVSWRTDAGIDGIVIASKWGGGGHPRASGATYRGTIADAEREIIAETVKLVDGAAK